jgi:hypothetical protein
VLRALLVMVVLAEMLALAVQEPQQVRTQQQQ